MLRQRTEHPQTFHANVARGCYYNEKYGKDKLHGVYVFGSDSKSARDASFASLGGLRDIGASSPTRTSTSPVPRTQSAYTPVIQEMKSNGSNYGQASTASADGAHAQGSSAAGPDRREGVGLRRAVLRRELFIKAGGADVEGQYVDTLFLPFYSKADQKANTMLANYVKYTGTDKLAGFGVYAWAAGIAFRDAVNAQVKAGGVNSVTRKTIFEQLNKINKFDAEGMIAPIDLAGRRDLELQRHPAGEERRLRPGEPDEAGHVQVLAERDPRAQARHLRRRADPDGHVEAHDAVPPLPGGGTVASGRVRTDRVRWSSRRGPRPLPCRAARAALCCGPKPDDPSD